MDYRNPDIDNPENWNGENLLGKVLNEVREKIKKYIIMGKKYFKKKVKIENYVGYAQVLLNI